MASGNANIVRVECDGSGLAHKESLLGESVVLTAEMFYVMDKKLLIEYAKDADVDLDQPTCTIADQLLEALSAEEGEIEEKIAEAAFRTLAPGRPIIPSSKLLHVLNHKEARKLATAYNMGSSVNWPVRKKMLEEKREEVVTAYRKELITRAEKKALEASLPKSEPDQRSSHKSVDSVVDDAACRREEGLPSVRLAGPGQRSPVFRRYSPPHAPTLLVKEESLSSFNSSSDHNLSIAQEIEETSTQLHHLSLREDQHALSDTCVEASASPCFVNMRRPRTQVRLTTRLREALRNDDDSSGFLPHHSRDNLAAAQHRESNPMGPVQPPSTPARISRRQSRNAVAYPRWDPENEPISSIYAPFQSTDLSPLSGNESESMYSHRKPGGLSGSFAGLTANKRDVDEAVSVSLYMQAQRGKYMKEGYPTTQGQSSHSNVSTDVYDSDTSADDDADIADSTWSSNNGESPTAVTLRKLARMRDEILRAKQEKESISAPVPVNCLDQTCPSTPTLQYCSFEFRGVYAEIPQTDERVGRTPGSLRRRPEWYARRDAESPTPGRRSRRVKTKNKEQEGRPLSSASRQDSDEDSDDMDITPLSLAPRIKFSIPVSSRRGETTDPFVV